MFTNRIYRYRSDLEDYDLKSLLDNELHFSKPESLNDPYEFISLGTENAQMSNAGIICFSRSITSPLLWAHYANGHRGFAICFDRTDSFFQNQTHTTLHDVIYEDLIPSESTYSQEELEQAAVETKPTCWSYEQEVRMIVSPGGETIDVPKSIFKELILGAKMDEKRVHEIVEQVKDKTPDIRILQMKFNQTIYGVEPHEIEI